MASRTRSTADPSPAPRQPRRSRAFLSASLMALVAALTLGGLAACGGSDDRKTPKLRLGYFPNLTHATPIVGVQNGIFAQKLGGKAELETRTFNAGPAAVEALFGDAVDAVYIGPNPTVNAYVKSQGQAVKVISGAASGGVAFVVKPGINGPADLKGKKIATPQLGNTQDVALRYWLKQNGLTANKDGGGDVKVIPQENSITVDAFANGAIDGAWVPEPFASRLVAKGGKVLVNERDLWPDKRFVITNLVVRTKYLKEHPEVIKHLLEGQVATTDYINTNTAGAQQAVSDHLQKLTGKPLNTKQTATAWPNLEFTNDPVPSSLVAGAQHAQEVGLLDKVKLDGIYDLKLLNEVLREQNKPEVKQA